MIAPLPGRHPRRSSRLRRPCSHFESRKNRGCVEMAFGPLPPALTRLRFPPSRRLPPVFGGRRISSTADRPDKDISPSSSTFPSVSAAQAEARKEAYRQLDNLDFMTAAKILFTTPPKRKEFGFDFHLVQFFFACLPSLGISYSTPSGILGCPICSELEEKKKKEEEEQKEKEIELGNNEEQPEAELSKVIARLDALEETVKVIANEKAKVPSSLSSKDRQVDPKGQVAAADKQFDTQNRSSSSKDQQVDPQKQVVAADKQFDTQNQTKAGEDTTISKKEQVSGSGHSSYIEALDKEGKGSVAATSGKSIT
ncbi:hypothetical protein ZIOFF_024313 [Zingiber officinale]|uniref:Uncharacterized protein n=1 Tax=Zingiber officinale TaxID=94328 RepID=A0A8J5LDG9_ZINOF|nr:hypothetical protein ZIOFF_024313 [Zingiber officinale]